ncbi:hypothetical protein ILYODFUR_014232 [Ilyodon furcidens]|uniref:Uncharacterized protein n=1 Tax=Ilyodon furcidens TaxID=33524 RepID=A0ABV0TIT7_9TELE
MENSTQYRTKALKLKSIFLLPVKERMKQLLVLLTSRLLSPISLPPLFELVCLINRDIERSNAASGNYFALISVSVYSVGSKICLGSLKRQIDAPALYADCLAYCSVLHASSLTLTLCPFQGP